MPLFVFGTVGEALDVAYVSPGKEFWQHYILCGNCIGLGGREEKEDFGEPGKEVV